MIEDLSRYRLNFLSELSDIETRIGIKRYTAFKRGVYLLLSGFSVNYQYNIVKEIRIENREIFVKLACLYIIEKGNDCNIEFYGGFNVIRGITSMNEHNRQLAKYKKQCEQMKNNIYEKDS